jgi:hypothetical protein
LTRRPTRWPLRSPWADALPETPYLKQVKAHLRTAHAADRADTYAYYASFYGEADEAFRKWLDGAAAEYERRTLITLIEGGVDTEELQEAYGRGRTPSYFVSDQIDRYGMDDHGED